MLIACTEQLTELAHDTCNKDAPFRCILNFQAISLWLLSLPWLNLPSNGWLELSPLSHGNKLKLLCWKIPTMSKEIEYMNRALGYWRCPSCSKAISPQAIAQIYYPLAIKQWHLHVNEILLIVKLNDKHDFKYAWAFMMSTIIRELLHVHLVNQNCKF